MLFLIRNATLLVIFLDKDCMIAAREKVIWSLRAIMQCTTSMQEASNTAVQYWLPRVGEKVIQVIDFVFYTFDNNSDCNFSSPLLCGVNRV